MAGTRNERRAAARRAARKEASRGKRPDGRKPGKPAAEAASQEPHSEALSAAHRVAWWALLVLVFLVPVATSNLSVIGRDLPLTFNQFDTIKVFFLYVLVLLALGAWAWGLLRRGGELRHTPIDWLVLAFLGWCAVTTVTSIHWPSALFGTGGRNEGLLTFVIYAALYFLVLQLAGITARVAALALSLFCSSVLVAGYGVIQFAGWDPIDFHVQGFEANRAYSMFGNPDLLGAFLVFSTTVALALALAERRPGWRLVYWAGFAVNGTALVATFARGAWIGALCGLVLLAVIAWRRGVRPRRLDWAPIGIGAVLGLGILGRSLSSSSEVMNAGKRLTSMFDLSGGSGQTRTEIWRAAFGAIKARPFLGWGADTFQYVFPRFKPVEYVRDAGPASVVDNAHDYPLQLAAGVGIVGMLLLYGIFVWAAVRSFRTVFGRSDDPRGLVLAGFWAAAAGYLVQLLFGLSLPGITFLLWIALGIVLAPTAKVVQVRAPRWGTAAAVVVAVVVALGIGYEGVSLAADNAYVSASASTGAARTEAARRAVRLNPLNGKYRTELGRAYFDEARDYLAAGQAAQKAGQDTSAYGQALRDRFASAQTAFNDAIAFNPNDYENYVYLTDLYNFGGDVLDKSYYDNAIATADEAIKLDPYGPAAHVYRARALMRSGRVAEAIAELKRSLAVAPTDGIAALALAEAYEADKDPAAALAALQAVDAIAPGQPGVAEAIQRLEAAPTPAP